MSRLAVALPPLPPVRYRACERCDHGARVVTPESCCTHPEVRIERDRRVHAVRAPGGACGPDAKFLDFPGLHAR